MIGEEFRRRTAPAAARAAIGSRNGRAHAAPPLSAGNAGVATNMRSFPSMVARRHDDTSGSEYNRSETKLRIVIINPIQRNGILSPCSGEADRPPARPWIETRMTDETTFSTLRKSHRLKRRLRLFTWALIGA